MEAFMKKKFQEMNVGSSKTITVERECALCETLRSMTL